MFPAKRRRDQVDPILEGVQHRQHPSSSHSLSHYSAKSCVIHLAVFAILKKAQRTALVSVGGISPCVEHGRAIIVDGAGCFPRLKRRVSWSVYPRELLLRLGLKDECYVVCLLQIDTVLTSSNLNTGVLKIFQQSPYYFINVERELEWRE
ncbi:hypothetical protein CSKR_108862 [Clonorchis sinensis]|uniref:Uncharacterized protein n=1 Tax=Clonorchis sinensis TaxID=79923 RepID=A0A3R7C5Z3_CLOSI|nr:hypothetical protein CSKR_108862 [Clonorchis sinensis]